MTHNEVYLPQIRALIVGLVTNISDPTTIQPERALYELGIDSLATVNLLVDISEAANVDLEDFVDDIVTPKTVDDLCALAAMFEMEKIKA
jgi:acyl carrier protein